MERKDAQLLGLKTYDTGRPCLNGHLSPRYVSTLGCIACLRPQSARNAAPLSPRLEALRLEIDADASALVADRAKLADEVRAFQASGIARLEARAKVIEAKRSDFADYSRMERASRAVAAEYAAQAARAARYRTRTSANLPTECVAPFLAFAASLAALRGAEPDSTPRRKGFKVSILAHPDDHALLKAEELRLVRLPRGPIVPPVAPDFENPGDRHVTREDGY